MERLLEGGTFFEGPRWHDGRWYVSDFYTRRVLSVSEDGASETVMEVEQQPSGLGWMPDGSMLVVSMKDHRILRRSADGEVTEHADLTEHCGGHANDMVVDRDGRAYVSNFGFDLMGGGTPQTGTVVRVEPDGTVVNEPYPVVFPNGMVITPDGATLIISETLGARMGAFTIAGDGSLIDQRAWAQVAPAPPFESVEAAISGGQFAPDGCTLDAEGLVWVADALGGRVVRVAEGGEIVDERRDPSGLQIYACMLGGSDGRTLLCCAAPSFLESERSVATEAVLLTTTVDVGRGDGLP